MNQNKNPQRLPDSRTNQFIRFTVKSEAKETAKKKCEKLIQGNAEGEMTMMIVANTIAEESQKTEGENETVGEMIEIESRMRTIDTIGRRKFRYPIYLFYLFLIDLFSEVAQRISLKKMQTPSCHPITALIEADVTM